MKRDKVKGFPRRKGGGRPIDPRTARRLSFAGWWAILATDASQLGKPIGLYPLAFPTRKAAETYARERSSWFAGYHVTFHLVDELSDDSIRPLKRHKKGENVCLSLRF